MKKAIVCLFVVVLIAGTLEVGKIADLVLLDANPLENIANTRKIRGVMVKGTWFSAEEIRDMLAEVRKSHTQ